MNEIGFWVMCVIAALLAVVDFFMFATLLILYGMYW